MKIAPTVPHVAVATQCRQSHSITPLECPEGKTLVKGECETIKLHTNPSNMKLPTCDIHADHFGYGEVEQHLLFLLNPEKITVGQNLATGPQKHSAPWCLLKGDTSTTFNAVADKHRDHTVAHCNSCMKDLAKHVFSA